MKIAFIGQPEYFRFCYEKELDFLGEIREFNLNSSMNPADFAVLQTFNADINIFFRGEFVPEEVLINLTGMKVNLSSEIFPKYINNGLSFSSDSIKRYEDFTKSMKNKSFDYIFHYDKTSIKFMEEDNLFFSGEFCFPVATETYKYQELPENWDLFFIGRSTRHRESLFGYLKHHYNFLHICHGLWGESLVSYMNQSKILLNIHAENEISWEPRLQMLMATGKMVISEKISCNSILIPGKDYVEVCSREELHKASEYYLENHAERLKIAESGKNKIIDHLSTKKIFVQFFKDLESNTYRKSDFSNFNRSSAQSRIVKLKMQDKLSNIKQRLSLYQVASKLIFKINKSLKS